MGNLASLGSIAALQAQGMASLAQVMSAIAHTLKPYYIPFVNGFDPAVFSVPSEVCTTH